MLNNVVLVGRVVEEPKLVKTEKGIKVANIILAVQRPFKNENNQYDTDFIPLQTWSGLAEVVCEYVGKGSIIGANCRLSTHNIEVGDLIMRTVDVVAEYISFIKLNSRIVKNDKTEKSNNVNVEINEDVETKEKSNVESNNLEMLEQEQTETVKSNKVNKKAKDEIK